MSKSVRIPKKPVEDESASGKKPDEAAASAKTSPKKAFFGSFRPIFKSLASRTKFVILLTAAVFSAASLVSLGQLRQAWVADARANLTREALMVTEEAASLINATHLATKELAAAARQSPDLTADCHRLVTLAAGRVPLANFGLATADGNLICRNDRLSGANISTIEPVRRAQRANQPTFGVQSNGDSTFVWFAAPTAVAGQPNLMAVAAMSSNTLAESLVSGTDLIIGLADRRGQGLARLTASDTAELVGAETPEALISEMLSLKHGQTEIQDTDGVTRLYAFRSLSDQNGGNLYLYAGRAKSAVLTTANLATWRVGGSLVITLITLFVLALLLANRLITRGVERLVRVIKQALTGKKKNATLPRGFRELDDVTKLFESMMAKLNEAQKTLEKRVKTRTAMLELSKDFTELTQARTEALLASIGEGVAATDRDGRLSFVNGLAQDALWWNPEKALGVPVSDAFKLEDEKENVVPDEQWPTWAAIRNGVTVNTPAPAKPFYLRRRDQSRFPVHMVVSPIHLGDEVAGALIVFTDITDQVEFDRRKSEFISIASHQLRSPMSAMKWMTSMLRKGDFGQLSDKQQEWADKLFNTTQMMVELVNELLNISRLEAGIKMKPVETDTNEFIDNTLAVAEPMLMEKKQRLAYARTDLPKAVFDPMMIGEVLKNFLSNASKYSPESSTVTLEVTATGQELKFAVTDQGIGIPKADHKQMFSKFFRAENALQSSVKGTGLGLYYCKTAAEAHGGSIGFDSAEGQGSTFWFTLPLTGPAGIKKEGE